MTLEPGSANPPAYFVAEDTLVGSSGEIRLSAEAGGGLMGWLSPVGVLAPAGDALVYNAWHEYVSLDPLKTLAEQGVHSGDPVGAPSLRTFDLATGEDVLFEDGAYSLAWRADGWMAYFKGLRRDFVPGERYTGHVFVQGAPDLPTEQWTTEPGRFIVAAWAGESLLVYRVEEGEHLDLLVFEGPAKFRLLAENGHLVALSPDGTKALIEQEGAGRLLHIASGQTLASLDLLKTTDERSGRNLKRLEHNGSWLGDRVVAETAGGLAVFRVRDNRLTLDQLLPWPRRPLRMGVSEPQFLDGSTNRVLAWAPIRGNGGEALGTLYVYLDCDIESMVCQEGPPRTERSFFRVYNPSRPEG